MSSNICTRPPKKEPKHKENTQMIGGRYLTSYKTFEKSRNYQTEQLCTLLYLLNDTFSIEIQRPLKTNTDCLPFVPVVSIKNGNDEVNVIQFIDRRIKELFQVDLDSGVSEKTAKRRVSNNKCVENLHLFSDILECIGYEFECKSTTGKKGRKKQTITRIYHADDVYEKKDIEEIGERINKTILHYLQKDKVHVFNIDELKM